MNCDLCGKVISADEMVPITPGEMQRAVLEGFNPFKTPGIDMSASTVLVSAFGLSAEQLFQDWRQRVMVDTTDWGLCPACAEVFRRWQTPTAERDYSVILESTLKSAKGSGELAVKNFEEQVASDPDTAEKFFWLGAAYMFGASAEKDLAYLDKAIGFFERALEIDPKHKNAYAKLLGAYISKGDDDAVRRTAMRWAKVDPDLPEEARQWLREQEAMEAVPEAPEEPAKPEAVEAKVICPKCQARNSPAQEVCSQCGAGLLPGRSIGQRVTRLVIGVLVAAFSLFLAGLVSIKVEGLQCLVWYLFIQGLAALGGGLGGAFGRTAEHEKYVRRAQRHIEDEPEQALDDFTRALELAPEKERAKIVQQRAEISGKLGLEPEELEELVAKPPEPTPPTEAVKPKSRLQAGCAWVMGLFAAFFFLLLVVAAKLTAMDYAKGKTGEELTGGISVVVLSLFIGMLMALVSVVLAERKKIVLAIWGVVMVVALVTAAIVVMPQLKAKLPTSLVGVFPKETPGETPAPTVVLAVPSPTVPSPTKEAAPTFVPFRGDVFSFEYPSAWDLISPKEVDILLETSLKGLKPGDYDYIGGVYKGDVDICRGCATIVVVALKNPSLTGTLTDEQYEQVRAAAEKQMGSRLLLHRKTEVSSMPAAESVHIGKSRLNKLWDLIIVPPEPGVAYLFSCSSHKDSYEDFEAAFERAIGSLTIEVSTAAVPTPAATATSIPISSPAPTPPPDAVVTAKSLNLRAGPGTAYDKVGLLHKGDELAVAAKTSAGNWLEVITADGTEGWASAAYVQLNISLDAVPVAAEIPPTPTPSAATPTPTITSTPLPAVDAEIEKIAKDEHGELAQPGETGHVAAGGEAEVTIINDTPYELTILVGAPNSVSYTIEACPVCKVYGVIGPIFCPREGRPERVVRLKPGSSKVAARVSDPSVIPFYGVWELKGDTRYFNCFYIVTGIR